MEKRELICIGCPMGCAVTVELEAGEIRKIYGNTCKTGENYARKEVTAPERTVTTTVRVKGGVCAAAPVKTSGGVAKDKIFDVIEALKGICLEASVSAGDTAVKDVCGTGADVTVTRTIRARD